MSDAAQRTSVFNPLETARQLIGETVSRWRGRLDMLRGTLVKDPLEQLDRLTSVIRHLGTYREIDRALFYHRFASTLLLAYRLGIIDAIVEGPATDEELADRCDLKPAAVRNLAELLEAQGLIHSTERGWEASSFCREFLSEHSRVSLAPLLDIGTSYAESFPAMVDAAADGQTPQLLDIFDDTARVDELLDGVNAYLDQAARELIARVDWPQIRHFIVGSMGVSFSSLILSEFSDARVTYGCLPHLVERIPRLRSAYGVDPGRVDQTHPHGGEPFEDRWGRQAFDLVFLTKKMILDPENDLGDKFARKTYQVLNPGGAAVFWETIHEDDAPTPVGRAMEGFLDFGVSPTAPVLTRTSFRQKLRDIGFQDVRFVCCLNDTTTFVVARRP